MLAVEKSSGKENSSLPLSALWPVMDLRKTDLFGRDRWLLSMEEGPHWCAILIEIQIKFEFDSHSRLLEVSLGLQLN